jgi:VacB/RNase II family 3'-5' exoribonuclease
MGGGQRALLLRVARQAMIEHGLEPDFPPEALAEAARLAAAAPPFDADVRDLRRLAWCSIDNDDSRDLDQLTAAVEVQGGGTRVLIAVADVETAVPAESAIDAHAVANTTSVYTPPQNFPMLPERLSTDLTSLGQAEDRLAIVIDVVVDGAGAAGASEVYRAVVRNAAKLAYPSVGAWLEAKGTMPAAIGAAPGLEANLRLQDGVAQRLRAGRLEHGALELETLETHARFEGDDLAGLSRDEPNRAKQLIEDFMITANGAIARFLKQHMFPIMRRVVRSPERWQRIVDIALTLNERLPAEPDAKALQQFLMRRRVADPLRFPDLSLSVIKLLGRGEYVASFPGQEVSGHFGLAVSDYTHSTAPNRRYPDLVTQRLIKAVLARQDAPYTRPQLEALAALCTEKEDHAQKVERLLRKAAAACLLSGRIGNAFDGLVTGAGPKGTWVRIFDPPAEGRLESGQEGLDVGDRVQVRLTHTDPERGFIDFARVAQVPALERQPRGAPEGRGRTPGADDRPAAR